MLDDHDVAVTAHGLDRDRVGKHRQVDLTGANRRHARGLIRQDVVLHGFHLRLPLAPVIGERREDRARVLHVLLQHERAGADHLGLEIGIRRVRQDRGVVGGQRRQERAIRRLHRERHRPLVSRLDALDRLELARPRGAGLRVHHSLEGELHVLGRQRLAVVERHALAKGEDVRRVIRLLPRLRKDAQWLAVVVEDQQGLVDDGDELEAGRRRHHRRIEPNRLFRLADDEGAGGARRGRRGILRQRGPCPRHRAERAGNCRGSGHLREIPS